MPNQCHDMILRRSLNKHRRNRTSTTKRKDATFHVRWPRSFGIHINKQTSARLAQSVERKALNLVVVGSSPTVGALPLALCHGRQMLLPTIQHREALGLALRARNPRRAFCQLLAKALAMLR